MDLASPAVRPSGRVHRDMIHVLLLVAFDVFAIYEAFVIAFTIRASSGKPLEHHMTIEAFGALAFGLAPLWITIFAISGLYSVRQRRGGTSELGRIVVAVACGVMTLIVLDYMRETNPIFPGRSVPIYSLLLGVTFVFGCRQIVRLSLRIAYSQNHGQRRVILVGTGPLAQRIAADLSKPTHGYRIVGALDAQADGAVFMGSIPVYPNLETALGVIETQVDELVQADTDVDRAEVARLMSYANSRGITYRFVPDQYGIYAAASSMSTIAGIPVMEVRLTALDGWGAV